MAGDAHPDASLSDVRTAFVIGTLPDGRVVLDFQSQPVDHIKLTHEEAFELAEGLIEAVRQAAQHGRIIDTGRTEIFTGK